MAAQLDHTIVNVRDSRASSRFLADILGLQPPTAYGPFQVLTLANGVSLDFIDADEDFDIEPQHYAFLVSEREFDEIFARILARGLSYWADPRKAKPGAINHHDGGRGVYFEDPDRHFLEIITRPYGSGG